MPRLVFLAVLLFALPASAHQASVTYSHVAFADDRLTYQLDLASTDLFEALALRENRDATDAEILAGRARLFAYVSERVLVLGCPLALDDVRIVTQTTRFARLHMSSTCTPTTLAIDYGLFFDLDAGHVAMLEVRARGTAVRRELTNDASRFEWDLTAAAPSSTSFTDFVASGVEHIFTGYDHICFVLALLLAAALAPRPVPTVLRLVTAFTVAHSITLIIAALGYLALPSRLVESAIAASIVYVAAENILATPRHRTALVFAFGLIHGLGFASLLRPMLPASDVIVPLLAFNLGVELGQLAIVAITLPALLMLARRPSYRRVQLALSALIGAFGVLWLVDRVFSVETISRFF